MRIKNYSELVLLPSFRERFDYLRFDGEVGMETFGYNRYMNQRFYSSAEWKHIRDIVIVRDRGCDLGIDGYEIPRGARLIIHHLNPITADDINEGTDALLNPEYLITTTHQTHNAIHYGDERLITCGVPERTPHDTCMWIKIGG